MDFKVGDMVVPIKDVSPRIKKGIVYAVIEVGDTHIKLYTHGLYYPAEWFEKYVPPERGEDNGD